MDMDKSNMSYRDNMTLDNNHGSMNIHQNINMGDSNTHNHDKIDTDNMNIHDHGHMNIDRTMVMDNMNMHDHDTMNIHGNMDMDSMNNNEDDGTMVGHMGMMQMHSPYFKAFTEGPFLFERWMTTTISGLVAAMMFSICLAIIYECTNYAFNVYHLRAEKWQTRQNKIIAHALLSLLKSISLAIAYVMMLCVMTYNFWILLAVIVGSGAGHLTGRPLIAIALRKKKTQENSERATKELLHDFQPFNGQSEEKDHRNAVTKSLDLNNFQQKLLRYDYDDGNV